MDSLTAEIAEIEKRRFGNVGKTEESVNINSTVKTAEIPGSKPKPDFSVTQILNETSKDTSKEDVSFNPVKPVQIKRFTPEKKTENLPVKEFTPHDSVPASVKSPISEVEAFMASPKAQTKVSDETLVPPVKQKVKDAVPHNLSSPPAKPLVKEPPIKPQTKRLLETVVLDTVPIAKPHKPTYLLPEEKERLQKLREEELLEKELALEDPDELLDGINPYDVKNIETPAVEEIVSVKMTRDIVDEAEDDAESHAEPKRDSEGVKEYKPAFEAEQEAVRENPREPESQQESPIFQKLSKGQKKKKGDFKQEYDITPMLESLNKTFAEKRKSDINVRRTLNVDTISTVAKDSYKGKTIPAKLNIDYKKQIIEDSAVLPLSDIHSKQLEERALGNKKKRKVRDFIFEDIDDEDEDEFYEGDDEQSDDYDGYDSSGQIWQDLNESHKGLKWRFGLLFVLTAVLAIFTFIHDFGSNPLRQYIIDEWFKGEYSDYAAVLVYSNLIAGVVGMCLCSGVIMRGLKNLFIGNADCDSACAVPCVMTTVASLAHIASNGSTALLQQGMAHIYVSVALCGLMFNTLGKILMIVRTKRNFSFISGDSAKYSAYMPGVSEDSDAHGFTKGILNEMPAPVFMRKTEFLTDYLKNSYCIDWADLICRKLVPISAVVALLMGVAAYFLPVSDQQMVQNICWAVTAGGAFIAALSPFSIMFLVNNPLLKASKSLASSDCVVMGFSAAQKFSRANAVVVDAGILFPAGSVKFLNVKRCQKPNAINSISIDESIVISASLAIKANSIMSSMFYDMINGDNDLLYKIENCIYEVNMGITGWMGSKRVMLGNREQMKHHGVDVPAENKERRHCPENGEVVYLAVGSEAVAMFFIEVVPNPAVKSGLCNLEAHGFVLSVKTKDSLVTVAKLADIFGFDPNKIRILPFDQHSSFDKYAQYTSRSSSEIACNGTFTSFARALVTAKALIRDMMVTSATLFVSMFIAALLGVIFVLFTKAGMLSPSTVIMYNTAWLVIMLILQGLRRY